MEAPKENPPTKEKPLLSIRPVFDDFQTALESAPVTLACVAAFTFIGGTFALVIVSVLGMLRLFSTEGLFGFFAVAGLVIVPPLYYELKKRAYSRTSYHFYKEYLAFQDFMLYFKRRRGRVFYNDIADAGIDVNFIQKRQKLETLQLVVPGMAQPARGGFSGIKVENLPRGTAEKILMLIRGEESPARKTEIKLG
jgi:hypothetical protein